MNKDALREELAEDEGCKFEIYLDHLQLPTFGIGHLIKEHDPEYGLPVGTEVSEDRVRKAFNLDIAVTIEDWLTVAAEAEDSRCFDQVPNRAKRLTARFRALADG